MERSADPIEEKRNLGADVLMRRRRISFDGELEKRAQLTVCPLAPFE